MDVLIPLNEAWRPAEVVVTPLRKAERPIIAVLGAIMAVHVAVFVYVAAKGFVRQPFSDMFDFIRAEFGFERSGDLIGYLASTHNQQHLVWIRILTALDIQVFHGSALIFLIAATASILIAAATLGVELWGATPARVVGATAGLLAAMLVTASINALDCTQPINAVYALAFGFAILAIVLFERAEGGAPVIVMASLSMVAAFGAVAGSAAGVAVFAVMIVSAIRNPNRRGMIPLVLVISLAAIAIVVTPLLSGAMSARAQGVGGHIGKMVQYFIVYAGMPWSAVGVLSRARLVIGGITIVVGAILLWRRASRAGAAGRLERIGQGLILFALITAAMAALGRVDESAAIIVPTRYAIFMSAFQVGVICVLAPVIADQWARVGRFVIPATLVFAVALLAQQAIEGQAVLRTSQIIRETLAAFDTGARRQDMHQLVYPDFNVALQVQAEDRRRGLYQ